uniref:Uncharacterized protein n=1 Tax=Micrurus spixii TaxID=129469 RepID=A0A2D4N223_9SAUR
MGQNIHPIRPEILEGQLQPSLIFVFYHLSCPLKLRHIQKEKRKKKRIIHIATGSPNTLMHSLHKHFNFFKISFTPSWDWNYIYFFSSTMLKAVFCFSLCIVWETNSNTAHI